MIWRRRVGVAFIAYGAARRTECVQLHGVTVSHPALPGLFWWVATCGTLSCSYEPPRTLLCDDCELVRFGEDQGIPWMACVDLNRHGTDSAL